MKKRFAIVTVCFLVIALLSCVYPTQSRAGDYLGDLCWNFSNVMGDTTASGIIRLGISHMGGTHYLCSGIISVTDPLSFQMPAFGNAELVGNKIYMTLSWQGRRYDTPASYTVGNDKALITLDTTTFNGTLEGCGVYYDAFEFFSGTVTLTSCP